MRKAPLLSAPAVLLLLAAGAAAADNASPPAERVYPGAHWQTKSAAAAGFDAAGLDAMAEYVGGFGCVVRDGYMVYTWGPVDRRIDVASACKPWFAHFLFKALEDGKIKSLDEPLVNVEPGLAELNARLGYKDREIAWRHLASQTSCYGVEEHPGKAYDYSDYNMALFYDNLFLKVYGVARDRATPDVLQRQLTDVLQCQDDPQFNDRGRLAITPRDFARFGLLYLRGGNWRGQQLLAAEHVHTLLSSPLKNDIPRTSGQPAEMLPRQRSIGGGSNQTDHLGSYSFTWWVNGVDRHGRRHWPDAPLDTFGAFGHNSKRALVVMPGKELIVAWNDSRVEGPEMANRALQLLLAAAGK